MTDIARKLSEPFPPNAVSWRIGSTNREKTRAMALAYIDARDVMNRLDSVCGPFGWQSKHIATGETVTCHIRIRDPESGEWITKSDGAGKTDVEGEKGSYSDSIKRAAVSWGIGRYLYDLDSPWVEIEARGNSYVIKQSEIPKLAAKLPAPGLATQLREQKPEQAETPIDQPLQHPRREEARAAWQRIHDEITSATSLAAIEATIKANSDNLGLVKKVSSEGYMTLMSLANARKSEFYGTTG